MYFYAVYIDTYALPIEKARHAPVRKTKRQNKNRVHAILTLNQELCKLCQLSKQTMVLLAWKGRMESTEALWSTMESTERQPPSLQSLEILLSQHLFPTRISDGTHLNAYLCNHEG